MLKTLVAAVIFCLSGKAYAVTPPPQNLSATAWSYGGSLLTWDDTTATAQVTQWFIYLNDIQLFSPTRNQIQTPSPGRAGFQLTGIAAGALPVVVKMKALAGSSLSAFSDPVTITAGVTANSVVIYSNGLPVSSTNPLPVSITSWESPRSVSYSTQGLGFTPGQALGTYFSNIIPCAGAQAFRVRIMTTQSSGCQLLIGLRVPGESQRWVFNQINPTAQWVEILITGSVHQRTMCTFNRPSSSGQDAQDFFTRPLPSDKFQIEFFLGAGSGTLDAASLTLLW
jgi:hypothetical protein